MENCHIEEPRSYEEQRDGRKAFLDDLRVDAAGEFDNDAPADWDDCLIYAEDALQDARRTNRDDLHQEFCARMAAIERAVEQIEQAKSILVAELAQRMRGAGRTQ